MAKRKNKPGYDKTIVNSEKSIQYLIELDTDYTVINLISNEKNIDCYLLDLNKKIVAKDINPSGNCLIIFISPIENHYLFKVKNSSKRNASISFVIN